MTTPGTRKIMLVAAISLVGPFSACGGSPSSPSAPTEFILVVQPTSEAVTFQATIGNQTYTAPGIFTQRLSPGAYTLSGTFSHPERFGNEGLIFIFHRNAASAGGVRIGSLRSVSGPVVNVASCVAVYLTSGITTATQSFSLQFEVTADSAEACLQPQS